jgi:hypothetical protein
MLPAPLRSGKALHGLDRLKLVQYPRAFQDGDLGGVKAVLRSSAADESGIQRVEAFPQIARLGPCTFGILYVRTVKDCAHLSVRPMDRTSRKKGTKVLRGESSTSTSTRPGAHGQFSSGGLCKSLNNIGILGVLRRRTGRLGVSLNLGVRFKAPSPHRSWIVHELGDVPASWSDLLPALAGATRCDLSLVMILVTILTGAQTRSHQPAMS